MNRARGALDATLFTYDTIQPNISIYQIPQRKAKAEELIELVVSSHLKVVERDYFGIYYAVRDQRVGVLYVHVRTYVCTHVNNLVGCT